MAAQGVGSWGQGVLCGPSPTALCVSPPGILAFFFFTHRIRIVEDTAPPLNYYWVPILVRTPGDRQEGGGEGLVLAWRYRRATQ